jgi:hypothetical protein
MIGQDNKKKFYKLGIFLIILLSIFIGVHHAANAANLSISVAEQTVYAGDTFSVDWFLDTEGKTINIVDAKLYYSPDVLESTEISIGSSALLLWVNQPKVIAEGVITFTGGVPGGINGSHIPLLRTVFKAKQAGNAVIMTINPTRVLLHDGSGTIVPLTMRPLSFSVLSKNNKLYSITSRTHPDQNKWYRNNTTAITVGAKTNELYSYSFNSNPEIIPSIQPQKIAGPITYANLADGIYYFKLAIPVNGILEEAGVYRVQIDRTAPTFLSSIIDKNDSMFDGKSFLNFFAADKTSGIANYKVKIGWFGFYHNAASPYLLSPPLFGNLVKIKAVDLAGNTNIMEIYYRGYLSTFAQYCVILGIIIIIGALVLIRRRKTLS